jgi:hypothetical protein
VRRRSRSREAAKCHSPGEGGCDGLYLSAYSAESKSWARGVFKTRWCWPAQRSPAYASRGRPRGCPPGPRSVVRRRSLSREAAKRHSPGEGGCDGLYLSAYSAGSSPCIARPVALGARRVENLVVLASSTLAGSCLAATVSSSQNKFFERERVTLWLACVSCQR